MKKKQITETGQNTDTRQPRRFSVNLSAFFEKKFVRLVGSVIAAIFLWFYIAVSVYPTTPKSFSNIPVVMDLSGSMAEANGMSAVSCDTEKVNVTVVGDRSRIGNLKAEDLVAHVEPGSISAAGEYSMPITVEAVNGINFEIDSITPSYAKVKLDKIETKTYSVEASFPNIRVTSGHALDSEDVVVEPSTVEITGPSAQLAEIDRVVVYSDKKQEIDGTFQLYSNQLHLYTKGGALLDQESLTLPSTDFQITIPILTTKEMKLTYRLLGAPTGFDPSWLAERLRFSEESITLASQTSSAFADKDTLEVGTVRLSEIGLDYSKNITIELDEEYTNRSGIEDVTLTLDNEGLATKQFTVTGENISVKNPPTDYNFNVVTKRLTITVIGSEETLNSLSADDIIVTADLLNYDNAEQASSFTQQAVISFYNKSDVWAYGSYSISLDRVEKTED
ncbi:MAG: hypothetical protein K5695_07665 [Oscillospiraceae bacterium]|nr:hypothetical protein [Oscillospiraceae bacterium]